MVKVLQRPLAPRVADGLFDAAQAVNALATLGVAPMVNATTCVVYLISGVAKVRSQLGVTWAGGEVLRGQIAIDGLRTELFGGWAGCSRWPPGACMWASAWSWGSRSPTPPRG